MRSNRFMTQKLILGHLISRNVLHILLNYLTRINDYMMFYLYIKSIPCDISTVDALLDLIEPSLYILKVRKNVFLICFESVYMVMFVVLRSIWLI